jgi:hypothetical protein
MVSESEAGVLTATSPAGTTRPAGQPSEPQTLTLTIVP